MKSKFQKGWAALYFNNMLQEKWEMEMINNFTIKQTKQCVLKASGVTLF